ncbi:MAG: hypothetical protein R6U96_06165 [Promethearchaeia archaeon]
MQIQEIVINVKTYMNELFSESHRLQTFHKPDDYQQFFTDSGVDVALTNNKEIILQEETVLELGGHHKKSYSLVISLPDQTSLTDGNVTMVGPTIRELREQQIAKVDFGLLVFLQIEENANLQHKDFKYFNFIGDGIEGFLIRTIPRRFWCRISSHIIKNFSFELLGHAINHLYREKFPNQFKAIEVVMVNSLPNVVEKLKEITSSFLEKEREQWKSKVQKWKEKVGCNYDWGCSICPDRAECYDIKKVLLERESLQE